MTDEFSQSILLKSVGKICQMVGYHNIMTSPLHILTDILRSFICHLGRTAQHYAEHCGRSRSNLNDLSLAFFDSGIRPRDLVEFLKHVGPLPKCISVPKYPITKKEVSVPGEESESLPVNESNSNGHTETLKIKISLSKIKEATKSKRNKSMKNKKKKKNKRNKSGVENWHSDA